MNTEEQLKILFGFVTLNIIFTKNNNNNRFKYYFMREFMAIIHTSKKLCGRTTHMRANVLCGSKKNIAETQGELWRCGF